MTTCLPYAPPRFQVNRRTAFGSSRFGNILCLPGLTGLSAESNVVQSRTADWAVICYDALSASLPVELEFQIQLAEWKRDTKFCSSPEIAAAHPAYQRIIGMGPEAVPLILREMEREPGLWFDALTAITGEQPVRSANAGDIEAMCADWLAWGRSNGCR